MSSSSKHLAWLRKVDHKHVTTCNRDILVYELIPDYTDSASFSEWAKHFRNHYCLDSDIDVLIDGTNKTKKEYLIEIKFPSSSSKLGPGIRSGDFSEIFIADFVEYTLLHWVPRTRYSDKTIRDESLKGTDLIGFKPFGRKESPRDVLSMFEIKAHLTKKKTAIGLQNAINDSAKDDARKAESLNALKQRLIYRQRRAEAERISRYQDLASNPYTMKYGAVAVIEEDALDLNLFINADASAHPAGKKDLTLMVVVIKDAMKLVNHLYETAANEA